jgi:HEAT repeat protein
LLLLARKCINKQERKSLYSPDSIRMLSEVVRTGSTYFSQLYALESVAWAIEDKAGLGKSDLLALAKMIRAPSPEESAALALKLKSGTVQEKDDALVLCGCFGTLAAAGNLIKFDDSISPRLVEMLTIGSDEQKRWAAYAVGNLVCDDTIRGTIEQVGCITPLVTLVRSGNDEQERWAARALGILALNSANRVSIAREGGIQPLVALVRSGRGEQKRLAAYALGNLACGNGTNRITMAREGSIPPLVTLLKSGTDGQKRWAAYALGNLACSNSTVESAICRAGVSESLQELCASEATKVRVAAESALDKVREYARMRAFVMRIHSWS